MYNLESFELLKKTLPGSIWKEKDTSQLYTIVLIAKFKDYHFPAEKTIDTFSIVFKTGEKFYSRIVADFLDKFEFVEGTNNLDRLETDRKKYLNILEEFKKLQLISYQLDDAIDDLEGKEECKLIRRYLKGINKEIREIYIQYV